MPTGKPTRGLDFAREHLLSCMESEVRAQNLSRAEFSGSNLPSGTSKACGERLLEKWKSLNYEQNDQLPVFSGDFFGAYWGKMVNKTMKKESKSRDTVLGDIYDSFFGGVHGTSENAGLAEENSVPSNISENTQQYNSARTDQNPPVANTYGTVQEHSGHQQESYNASHAEIWPGGDQTCFFTDAYEDGGYGVPTQPIIHTPNSLVESVPFGSLYHSNPGTAFSS